MRKDDLINSGQMTNEEIQLWMMRGHRGLETFDYSIAVDWALTQVKQGKETDKVLILASISKPYNHYEVAPYVDAVLDELGHGQLGYEVALISIAYPYVKKLIAQESILKNLAVLKSHCIDYGQESILMDFYLLHFSWMDLEDLGFSNYYYGVTKENFDEVTKRVATDWVQKYVYDSKHL